MIRSTITNKTTVLKLKKILHLKKVFIINTLKNHNHVITK